VRQVDDLANHVSCFRWSGSSRIGSLVYKEVESLKVIVDSSKVISDIGDALILSREVESAQGSIGINSLGLVVCISDHFFQTSETRMSHSISRVHNVKHVIETLEQREVGELVVGIHCLIQPLVFNHIPANNEVRNVVCLSAIKNAYCEVHETIKSQK
jgi:hypothetical protein